MKSRFHVFHFIFLITFLNNHFIFLNNAIILFNFQLLYPLNVKFFLIHQFLKFYTWFLILQTLHLFIQ